MDQSTVTRPAIELRSLMLSGVESKANWLRRDAEDMQRYAQYLRTMPPYETKAEDELAKAETELLNALTIVKLTREEISKRART